MSRMLEEYNIFNFMLFWGHKTDRITPPALFSNSQENHLQKILYHPQRVAVSGEYYLCPFQSTWVAFIVIIIAFTYHAIS